MRREDILALLVDLLQETLDDQEEGQMITASPDSPLIGAEAVATSMALVSFISDVELTLVDEYDIELTLVSEQALSRRHSPFRTIATLADYVVELIGEPVEV